MHYPVVSEIDKRIKKKFQLFRGIRPKEEDQQIYDKVYSLCFDELVCFVEENLDSHKQQTVAIHLETIQTAQLSEQQKQQLILEIMLAHLEDIPSYRFRLQSRLDYFLASLLF